MKLMVVRSLKEIMMDSIVIRIVIMLVNGSRDKNYASITIDDTDYVNEVYCSHSDIIHWIHIKTKKGKSLQCGKMKTDKPITYDL